MTGFEQAVLDGECRWYFNGEHQVSSFTSTTWTDGKVDPVDILILYFADHKPITIMMSIEHDCIDLIEGDVPAMYDDWDDEADGNLFESKSLYSMRSEQEVNESFSEELAIAVLNSYTWSADANGIDTCLL